MKSFVRQFSGSSRGRSPPRRSPKSKSSPKHAKPTIPRSIAFEIEDPEILDRRYSLDELEHKASMAHTVDTLDTAAETMTEGSSAKRPASAQEERLRAQMKEQRELHRRQSRELLQKHERERQQVEALQRDGKLSSYGAAELTAEMEDTHRREVAELRHGQRSDESELMDLIRAEHKTSLSNTIETLSTWDTSIQERMASLSNTIASLLDNNAVDARDDDTYGGWSDYSFGSARRCPTIRHFLWKSTESAGPVTKLDEMCFEQVIHLMSSMGEESKRRILDGMLNRAEF